MNESSVIVLYERINGIGVVSYYLPRLFFLAGLQEAVFRNFNEIAFFGQAAVWGVGVSQIFQYFFNHSDDPPRLKSFVVTLWCLGAAHQGFTTYLVASLFLNGTLTNTYEAWTLILFNFAFLFMAFVSILAQSFYIYQIWLYVSSQKLLTRSRSFLIPITLSPFVLFQLVLPSIMLHNTNVYAGVDYYKPSVNVLSRFHLQQNLFLATLIVNVGLNYATFIGLAVHLRKSYFGPCLGFEKNTPLFWRVAFFTVNTGMWAAIYSILALTMFCIMRVGSTYIVLHFHFLSAIYCSSILASVNARNYLRPTGDHAYLPPPAPKPLHGLSVNFWILSSSWLCSELTSYHQGIVVSGRMQTMVFQRTITSDCTTSESVY
ncbi:hypothetical protein GALMADRAFT_277509 [Galerina marginata CBS 339.88]|uniref:DUF6534 domain-containing protein n=1 Tax=Galerina marginata (strain CBS 339.88) TaxID=685588 RepID=A0A067TK62_GALM3|nr:hypothetical protein GALMADRAFT_277509 [Galerina marginata CBS 339.88]